MKPVIDTWDLLFINALFWLACFIAGVAVGRLGV